MSSLIANALRAVEVERDHFAGGCRKQVVFDNA